LFSETDRRTDLSDTLMFGGNYRTVYLGVSTKSVRWQRWDEDNLEKIEALIKYDITFDGDRVQITRLGKKGAPCSTEFLWRLQIRSA
jgi:hypothetical protein